jgi:hypothetical protein
MPRVIRPVGVASGSQRSQGLSYQGDRTLGAIWGANEQTDLSQPGGGCPGTALEDLLVNVDDGAIVTNQAPPDGLWDIGCAHGPTTVGASGRESHRNPVRRFARVGPGLAYLLALGGAGTRARSRAGPTFRSWTSTPDCSRLGCRMPGIRDWLCCCPGAAAQIVALPELSVWGRTAAHFAQEPLAHVIDGTQPGVEILAGPDVLLQSGQVVASHQSEPYVQPFLMGPVGIIGCEPCGKQCPQVLGRQAVEQQPVPALSGGGQLIGI